MAFRRSRGRRRMGRSRRGRSRRGRGGVRRVRVGFRM